LPEPGFWRVKEFPGNVAMGIKLSAEKNISFSSYPSFKIKVYFWITCMDKSLSQITFEFFNGEQQGNSEAASFPTQPLPEQKPLPKSTTRGRKALKDLMNEAELIEVPEDEVLFQKQYYSIGEVANMFKVNTSLIRYWENEFDIIEPRKNRKGDRFFKPVDVKNLQLIHDLLRRRKFTIEGAKEYIKKNKQAREKHELILSLQKLKSFLLEVRASL
jgi:DNA-binding transcriptional MerR regulator